MKRLFLLLLGCAGFAFAQGPAQCLYQNVWVPCSLVTGVQEAQAVNAKVSGGAGTTITQAFGSTTTKGNSLLCLGIESAAAAPTFTDADGDTFVVAGSSATAPGITVAVATNIAGASTNTITETVTSGAAAFACHELKGTVTAGQVWNALNIQQGTAAAINFAPSAIRSPNEMTFAVAGFNAGTVNATPALAGPGAVTGLTTVDASNTAVTGGAALAVFYAAHATANSATVYAPTLSLSGSETFSAAFVTIKPPYFNTPATPQLLVNGVPVPSFQTYGAAKTGLAPASAATDIAVLSGNATNTVVPTLVTMSCTQTTAGIVDVQLLIRTTADSAGTSTGSPTTFPLDQSNSAAVSSVLTYTANPTVNDGTARLIDSQKLGVLAAATASPADLYIWRPSIGLGQSVVLRGTAQQLAVNLNGATVTGGSCDIRYQWIETTGL